MATALARPKSVKVGPYSYEIRWLTDEEWKQNDHNGDWGGEADHEQCVVYLRTTLGRSEQSLKETLLHEMQHMVWHVIGLNHYPRPEDPDVLEEYVVTSTSPTLLEALRANPQVLKYLLS